MALKKKVLNRRILKKSAIKIFDELKYSLSKLDYIYSATLIGENINERKLDAKNDFDIPIIVKSKMTRKKYNRIEGILKKITKYSTDKIDVLYDIADGPREPVSKKSYKLFWHIILHTKSSYVNNPNLFVKNSWQFSSPFLGKSLSSLQTIKGVTKEMLLSEKIPLSIPFLIKSIKTHKGGYFDWTKEDAPKLKFFKSGFFSKEEKAELYFYSILRAASNYLRFKAKNNKIGIRHELLEIKKYHPQFTTLISNTLKYKKKLRNNQLKITNKFLNKMQEDALCFLLCLKEDLKND